MFLSIVEVMEEGGSKCRSKLAFFENIAIFFESRYISLFLGRRTRNEALPPLPTYEDATKLPPLRHNLEEDAVPEEESTSPRSPSVQRTPSGDSLLENVSETNSTGSPIRPSTSASGSAVDSIRVEAPTSEQGDQRSSTETLDRESSIRRSI